jgi:hypothetical protein
MAAPARRPIPMASPSTTKHDATGCSRRRPYSVIMGWAATGTYCW